MAPEPTQEELDQADPIGGVIIEGGRDTDGNPVIVAADQEPVSRLES